MRTIAHISDLHFGATEDDVVAALLRELAQDTPDVVLVSGDLTSGARAEEFRAARAFLDAIPTKVLTVPGNHDISPYRLFERFLNPYGTWRREMGTEPEWSWHDEELGVVGVNTVRRIGPYLDWSRGRLGAEAVRDVEARLDALPTDTFRIVVAHHPFLPPETAAEMRLVGGAAHAIAAFAQRGVRLVLSGHLHIGYVRAATQGLAAGPGGARSLQVVQAGSATSHRLRGEPNAYNRITIEDGEPTIEVRAWDGSRWKAAGTV